MKMDRFSRLFTWAAVAALAGLLLGASLPAAGQILRFQIKKKSKGKVVVTSTESLGAALAAQVAQVRQRFAAHRAELQTVRGEGSAPAHRLADVDALISRTREDLGLAIEQVQEPGLSPLNDWAKEELEYIQQELTTQGRVAVGPLPVARVASLGGFPVLASVAAATPRPETIPVATSNRFLDQVGEVIGRIFSLAEKDDLEVDLWVGSTPAEQATFRFWSQGRFKGSAPAPVLVRTNGTRERVLRGVYVYSASWTQGPVTEVVAYPSPAGARVERSERLDLVTGTRFFCCRFNEQACQHVSNEKECRP